STLALAGGGLKMGRVIGESTAKAEQPRTTPITPQDLMATIFHVLGIPQDMQYKDPSGRPVSMIDGGKPVAEVGWLRFNKREPPAGERARRRFLVGNGAEGDRTPNLSIANAALSQLSYGPDYANPLQ